jgi:cobalamin biosynthesis protein CobD/CbiB
MNLITKSLRRLSSTGRVVYLAGLLALIVLVLITFIYGTVTATLVATLSLAMFLVSGPFVLSGMWRTRQSQPSRRPVVRRRRY